MSRDLNFFTCIGRVTKDPELKYLPSGMQVTNFSLAVNDSCKKMINGKIMLIFLMSLFLVNQEI